MKILIVDVETVFLRGGGNLPYDIGYLIMDTKTKTIYCKRSFAVYELFVENTHLLNTAYYKEKIPSYWDEIKKGTRILWGFSRIKQCVHTDLIQYNVKRIFAYNAQFDISALNYANRYYMNDYNVFFDGLEIGCIWNMACQIICKETYIKFCIENNFFSEKGYIKTGAEYIYRFIKKDVTFQEIHKGLQDVYIETEILCKILSRKKKTDININTKCYLLVQEKYLEFKRKMRKKKKNE